MESKQLDQFAKDWILTRSLTLAKSINKTTLEALRRELALGFEAGESIQQLTKRIEGYFEGNTKYRAELVSRTEVQTAANQGANHRYQLEGIKQVEWLTARGGNVCEECQAMDGKILPIDSGERPPLHPQCVCTILPYLD